MLERGYEGLVAKEESSPYRGGRTLSWIKIRQRDYRVEERGWSQDVERSPKHYWVLRPRPAIRPTVEPPVTSDE